MKKLNRITIMLGLVTLALASCGDASEEITDMIFNRNLSPLDVEATNVTETTTTLKWTPSSGATGYIVEIFANDSLSFEGSPQSTLTVESPSVFVSGLQYGTKYSARVQAITDGNDSRTSKWSGVYFLTNAHKLLKTPVEADIVDRSVTISWNQEEGYDVTTIIVGDITHEITEEEKAAGKAVIDGLTPETEYNVQLLNGYQDCGTCKFTTIADLEGATVVSPDDNLRSLLENAEEGQVFALKPGEYTFSNDDGEVISAKISKSVVIKGIYSTSRPVIYGRLQLDAPISLTLSQTVWDGSQNNTGDQFINFKGVGDYGDISISNTEVRNFVKGFFYLNVKGSIPNFTISNCLIHHITCDGGDLFDSRAGYIGNLTIEKSTVYESAKSRDFIRYDDSSSSYPSLTTNVVVNNCTLYNVGNGEANYRLLYVRFVENKLTFTNNLVVNFNNKRGFTNQAKSDQSPTLSNNYYFNCQNLTSAGNGADPTISWFDTNGIIDDPKFANPDNGDFTLNADSKAAKGGAGDPRWIK